jgi:hypothetical protein
MEYETKEVQYGNAIIVINRPVLTEAERTHRESNIKTTLRIIGKEMKGEI